MLNSNHFLKALLIHQVEIHFPSISQASLHIYKVLCNLNSSLKTEIKSLDLWRRAVTTNYSLYLFYCSGQTSLPELIKPQALVTSESAVHLPEVLEQVFVLLFPQQLNILWD